MKHSFKFFANKDCRYYPCHKTADPEHFNCLFCFCPLYFLDDCGGNYKMTRGVKDCTDCTLPHDKGGYAHVLKRLKTEFTEMRKNAAEAEKPDESA
ncbi:cysteine-rich small domain-containing protein [Desulfobaculum bizertense]|uniref:cysteine-rich small domain-containing protein n=1 Tax=Desulfobaculum bizertense TaxID=376490 RepID=UPI001F26531F|nr:cysteine-rich small domain-containing protein [Desulfobaculum bizertense]UIJ37768.1 cysteine-rich small domain-containing protein [Desulfobaculum bizertense]